MKNNLYHKGDLVVCIDPGSDKLTAGKTYVVLVASILPCGMDEWDLFLYIQDDLEILHKVLVFGVVIDKDGNALDAMF